MGSIEWAMWGNEQGLGTAFVLLIGGILAVIGKFKRWEFGAYAIALGIFVWFVEYPRSKRAKGHTTRQRRFQNVPAVIVKAMGPLGKNYYVRFIIYMLTCVPCVFQLATVLGAFSLLLTSIIYLKAALNGEKWLPIDETATTTTGRVPSRMRPPSFAPPRLKKRGGDGVENTVCEGETDIPTDLQGKAGSRI